MVSKKSLANLRPQRAGYPSLNPGGRPVDEFAKLVREKRGLPQELFEIVLAKAKSNGPDSLKAAEFMIERGWGKAPMQIESDSLAGFFDEFRERHKDDP